MSEGHFDLDDYIDYLIEILHHLGPNAHVMAVCQPSVPVLATVALMSEDRDPLAPRTMTLMGGPIDTRLAPTAVNQLAEARGTDWFRRNTIMSVPFPHPGFMRKVYPGFLQLSGFMAMNYDRHVTAHQEFYQHLVDGDGDSAEKHREFYDEYLAVMDLTAEFYLQTVETVFVKHLLPNGLMTHRGRLVRTETIRHTALLTVEGERDDISGVGQTKAAHTLCSNLAVRDAAALAAPRASAITASSTAPASAPRSSRASPTSSPSITPRQTAAMATGVAPRARQTAGRESAHSSESTSPVILGTRSGIPGSSSSDRWISRFTIRSARRVTPSNHARGHVRLWGRPGRVGPLLRKPSRRRNGANSLMALSRPDMPRGPA